MAAWEAEVKQLTYAPVPPREAHSRTSCLLGLLSEIAVAVGAAAATTTAAVALDEAAAAALLEAVICRTLGVFAQWWVMC